MQQALGYYNDLGLLHLWLAPAEPSVGQKADVILHLYNPCCRCCTCAGALLHLDGMNAFDAATHCAAFTAAERISKQQQEQEGQEQLEQDDSSMDSSMDSDDDVIQEPLQYRQASFDAASVPVGVGMQYMCPGSDSMAAEA